MSEVLEITDRSEFQDLLDTEDVVVVKFWATWCGPCRFISPIFEQFSEREEFRKRGVVFAKVDGFCRPSSSVLEWDYRVLHVRG